MWISTGYTEVGRGHLRSGMPCQDKVKEYRNRRVSVITLADGAGSSRLSHLGAEAVLSRVSRELGKHYEEYYREEDPSVIRRRLLGVVFSSLEDTRRANRCELADLSSTLLAVAVSGCRYIIVHIGDGVIGYLKENEMRVASEPDNGSYANATYFTTSPSVLSHMKIIKGKDKTIGGFVLMSDGTGNSLYDKRNGSISPGVKRIMQRMVLYPEKTMQQMLSDSFHNAIINRTLDDCSISLLANTRAFPSFSKLSHSEQLGLLQMSPTARKCYRRIRQAGEMLGAASKGATASQIARIIHVRKKHVRKKLTYLRELGLLDKKQGVYYSALYEIYTDPKQRKKRLRRKEK